MTRDFHAAASLRGLLIRNDCPKILQQNKSLLEKLWHSQDTIPLDKQIIKSTSKVRELADLPKLETALQNIRFWRQIPVQVNTVARLIIAGKEYAPVNISRRAAFIHIRPNSLISANWIPAQIVCIIHAPNELHPVLLAIQRRRVIHDQSLNNPWTRYPDYGVELWSALFEESWEIIAPATHDICHSIYKPWKETSIVATKPLNRASVQ
jgi:hypothetical protein